MGVRLRLGRPHSRSAGVFVALFVVASLPPCPQRQHPYIRPMALSTVAATLTPTRPRQAVQRTPPCPLAAHVIVLTPEDAPDIPDNYRPLPPPSLERNSPLPYGPGLGCQDNHHPLHLSMLTGGTSPDVVARREFGATDGERRRSGTAARDRGHGAIHGASYNGRTHMRSTFNMTLEAPQSNNKLALVYVCTTAILPCSPTCVFTGPCLR